MSSNAPPPPPGEPDPFGQQPSQQPPYGAPPPPPPPPPAYGYQQQPYGYGGYSAAPETESGAIIALVLAIASFVVCPVVPAVVALVVANNADTAIEASGGRKTGDGLTKAARIISWVNIGIFVAVIVAVILIAVLAAASSS